MERGEYSRTTFVFNSATRDWVVTEGLLSVLQTGVDYGEGMCPNPDSRMSFLIFWYLAMSPLHATSLSLLLRFYGSQPHLDWIGATNYNLLSWESQDETEVEEGSENHHWNT